MEHPIGTGVIDFSRYNGLSLDEIRVMMNETLLTEEDRREEEHHQDWRNRQAVRLILESIERGTVNPRLPFTEPLRYQHEDVLKTVRATLRDLDAGRPL